MGKRFVRMLEVSKESTAVARAAIARRTKYLGRQRETQSPHSYPQQELVPAEDSPSDF